jgi:phosphoribosylformylglycinamidine synthase subunit PurSL
MAFLHEGRPVVVREATWTPPADLPEPSPSRTEFGAGSNGDAIGRGKSPAPTDFTADLLSLLSHGDVCSKEWIIRQYDHEVQARTVLKPLVGANDDGPGDAAVILPVRGSTRGLAVGCGLNPRYGKIDPYQMAACVIDEAIRNCVAVGADPDRIALLDNFCWGNTERPETLGSLVLAAEACRDTSLAYRTPFISGKDSLYNEYTHEGRSLAIPPTLLISAIGQVPDIRRCVTMDFKQPGNFIMLLGVTRSELGGSIWAGLHHERGGRVPQVDAVLGRRIFTALHAAINAGLVVSCHDLSEGGLAVALAEMAIAGGLGANVTLDGVRREDHGLGDHALLFSESPTRFLIETSPLHLDELQRIVLDLPSGVLGIVTGEDTAGTRLIVKTSDERLLINETVAGLKAAWQRPLCWT